MQRLVDVSGVWLGVALGLGAGVQGANGEHSCEETALHYAADGCVSAADTTDEAMLPRVSGVAPSSPVAMTSSPSCDPWGSGSHWKPLGESGMT